MKSWRECKRGKIAPFGILYLQLVAWPNGNGFGHTNEVAVNKQISDIQGTAEDRCTAAYQIAASVLVGAGFLVEAADRKPSATVGLAVLSQVAPCYWQIVHNPAAQHNTISTTFRAPLTL